MTDNPYESPTVSQTVREKNAGPGRNDTRTLNSWLASFAVAVTGFSTFGIWSAARIFEDYVKLEMADVFSRGVGWCFGGAWIVAFVATFALSGLVANMVTRLAGI
jgi:hypothetical protein